MGCTFEILKLSAGLVLYILDVGSDIYVATTYNQDGETLWFSFTIACVIVSSLIINVTAFRNRSNKFGTIVYVVAFIGQMCVIVRFVEQLVISLKRGSTDNKETAHKLDQVRYTEALSESAPQWCIQTYIMLRLWSFPWHVIASTVISFLSLTWGFVSVRTSLMMLKEEDAHTDYPYVLAAVLFVSQLGFLVSRLSLLVIVAYALTAQVAIVFALRLWLFVLLIIGYMFERIGCYGWCQRMAFRYGCESPQCNSAGEVNTHEDWLCIKILFISFFDVTISQGRFEKSSLGLSCVLYLIESLIGCLLIWLQSPPADIAHMELMRYIAFGSVLGGLGLGVLFFGIYFLCDGCKCKTILETEGEENDGASYTA